MDQRINLSRIVLAGCIFLTLIATIQTGQYNQCHYTCQYCASEQYSHCISCWQNYQFMPLKNQEALNKHRNSIKDYAWGSCMGVLSHFNPVGVALFLIVLITFAYLRNRTIFYFFNTMQTFALLSLIEIGYVQPLSYILQVFQYFMFLTALNKQNKQSDIQVYENKRYRMYQFLRQFSFSTNMLPVFLLSLCAFIIVFITPLCRYFAKKQGSVWSICNCFNIPKIFVTLEISFLLCFFFTIQQTVLVYAVGVFLDKQIAEASNIILMIVYALLLAIMLVNICSKNLQLFANKVVEQTEILKKCILPFFIVLPVGIDILIIPFMFLLALLGIIFNSANNKELKKTQFHQKLIKRQHKYRIIEVIIICMIAVYYVVQMYAKNYQACMACGIIVLLLIILFILSFFFEVGLEIYGKCWLKQNQKLYQTCPQITTTLRPKNLQQTLQNLEYTQQGIMDMVFFNRNISSQKQIPENSGKIGHNIHINLDNLQDQASYQQQKEKCSSTTTPKNRDFEKNTQKSRTARTPNNKSSRFRLNKIFQIQDHKQYEKQIENIEVFKPVLKQQQLTPVNVNPKKDTLTPQSSRRDQPIKTTRQINFQIQQDQTDTKKLPHFGKQQEQIEQVNINEKEHIEPQEQQNQGNGEGNKKEESHSKYKKPKKNSRLQKIYAR